MCRKLFVIAILLFLVPVVAFAQMGKLRGVVLDQETGEPLINANVLIVGTAMGASTDMNGVYVVMAVPPGLYAVKATYIGYQPQEIQNIRVSASQTKTQDFQLSTTAIRGEALVIVADRPLIQRNTTNTVRMTTEEDIQNLPIRGLQNIIALNAGTVQQDGELHIRGGRAGEVAYFVDGANATNPLYNSEMITVIQEAIEEVQMQAGGYTAEYGGANSGIVNTTIRTGGSSFKGTLDYRTDDFVKGGNTFLGTTSQGYHNVVATISGPLTSKLRFFVAGQYNYMRNRSRVFIEPFEFNPVADPSHQSYAPWFVEDGLEGRTGVLEEGLPFTDVNGDTIPLMFERNFLPNNHRYNVSFNGTVVYNVSNSLKLRLTGSYGYNRQPSGWSSFSSALSNTYNSSIGRTISKQGLVNLRATHVINPTTFYDVNVSWSTRNYKYFDPQFGDDWVKYSDSREWIAAGIMDTASANYELNPWQSLFRGPVYYSTISNFTFTPPGTPLNSYSKNSQTSIGASMDFSTQLTKNIELRVGGRFNSWSMRHWNIGNVRSYLTYLYGTDGTATREFDDDYVRRIEISNAAGINYYGWDVDGVNKVNSGPNGPRKPLLASMYFQTKLEYRDLVLNLGLRYERYDIKAPRPESLEDPARDIVNAWIDEDAIVYTDPYNYILPRLNFAFPVTDNTVFYAQYGEYVQYLNLSSIYQSGLRSWVRSVLPEYRNVRGTEARFLAKPERTNQYELGIRQTITENFAFTVTLFYKDLLDQVRGGQILADGTGELEEGTMYLGGYVNDDVGTSKGLELTLELRRTNRLAARVNYTLSNTQGTGSDLQTTRTAVSDVQFGKYPLFISNLDYNQPHRGTVMLDYRFGKGDGGKILEGFGINALMRFNSGHSYTKIAEPKHLGQSTPWNVGIRATYDTRQRHPVEPVNSSLTPWNFNIDLRVDKMFYFNRFNIKLYADVRNLLNTKNIINVYATTGVDDDDGWLKSPHAVNFIETPGYLDFYNTINLENRWHLLRYVGQDLWSQPRSIHFGVMVEVK